MNSNSKPTKPQLERVLGVLAARTHYEVLCISPGEVDRHGGMALARVRRGLARACHPDFWSKATTEDAKLAGAAMARINVAIDALSEVKARRRYEMTELARTHDPCNVCKGAGEMLRQRGFKAKEASPCSICGGHGWLMKRRST
jgi:DnaJ-class molecular chaperone